MPEVKVYTIVSGFFPNLEEGDKNVGCWDLTDGFGNGANRKVLGR